MGGLLDKVAQENNIFCAISMVFERVKALSVPDILILGGLDPPPFVGN